MFSIYVFSFGASQNLSLIQTLDIQGLSPEEDMTGPSTTCKKNIVHLRRFDWMSIWMSRERSTQHFYFLYFTLRLDPPVSPHLPTALYFSCLSGDLFGANEVGDEPWIPTDTSTSGKMRMNVGQNEVILRKSRKT